MKLNRLHLKLIAAVSMLADHVFRVFFSGTLSSTIVRQSIGRLAFPLFVFMLCRGFFYTRSRLRYGLSLLITAVISEPVYDLLFYRKIWYPGNQNVIFTLLTILIMLAVFYKTAANIIPQILIAAGFAAAAQLLHFDYGAAGVAVGYLFFLTRNREPYKSCAIACVPVIMVYGTVGAWLDIFVLWYYQEARVKLSVFAKYFFYIFYPAHLAVLLLIRSILR